MFVFQVWGLAAIYTAVREPDRPAEFLRILTGPLAGLNFRRRLAAILLYGTALTILANFAATGIFTGGVDAGLRPGWWILRGLVNALAGLSDGSITFGRRKRRGFGQVMVERWQIKTYDLQSAAGLLDWLENGARPLAEQNGAAESPDIYQAMDVANDAADARHWLDLVARFALDAPQWMAWPGFYLAWGTPWVAGAWWRARYPEGHFHERRTGALLLLGAGAGAESRQPIGIVVVFGVAISAVLTLFVVPSLYVLFARRTSSPQRVARLIEQLQGTVAVPPRSSD